MNATTKNLRSEILSVIRDGSRIDRYLTEGRDGWYLTTENTSEEQIKVEAGLDTTEDQEEEAADEYLRTVGL